MMNTWLANGEIFLMFVRIADVHILRILFDFRQTLFYSIPSDFLPAAKVATKPHGIISQKKINLDIHYRNSVREIEKEIVTRRISRICHISRFRSLLTR